MKLIMRRGLPLAVLAGLLLSLSVAAQSNQLRAGNATQDDPNQVGRLQLNELDRLEAKAKQVVDVSIDHRLIRFLAGLLSDKKPDEAQLKQIVLGLKGIYVRSYEFDDAGVYGPADLDFVRRQIKSPLWSRIVGVRSTVKGENVEVYTMLDGEKMNGLAIIAAEPKNFTVVNVVGMIDLEKLRMLEGHFGVPKLEIGGGDDDKDNKAKPDNKDPKKP